MTLCKKEKIIKLSVKNPWKFIIQDIKIPLTRIPTKCGRACELQKICNSWSYNVYGTMYYNKSSNMFSRCYSPLCSRDSSKFSYIFIFDSIRKFIPMEALIELGLYREPKISSKKSKYCVPGEKPMNFKYATYNKNFPNKTYGSILKNYKGIKKIIKE